jgi:hypothetical protein
MPIDELTGVLERWCDAVTAAENAPPGSRERVAAERRVARLDLEVRRAALRLTGQRDQLDGAIEASWSRLAASNAILDDAWRARLDAMAQRHDHGGS